MKHILVTGGAGFIGANFVPYFIENNPEYHLVNLDLLTYAGNLDNVKEVENHSRYTFVQGDICDRNFVEALFQKYLFHDVIHFAAESHVDNSISGPEAFIKTNVLGTNSLLRASVNSNVKTFVNISTDKAVDPSSVLGKTKLIAEISAPESGFTSS